MNIDCARCDQFTAGIKNLFTGKPSTNCRDTLPANGNICVMRGLCRYNFSVLDNQIVTHCEPRKYTTNYDSFLCSRPIVQVEDSRLITPDEQYQ